MSVDGLREREPGVVRVRLLGNFDVSTAAGSCRLPPGASRLVAYLALHRRPHPRALVAGLLWPETTQNRAQARLRSTLWRVRRCHDGIVAFDTSGDLMLHPGVEVDTDLVAGLARRRTAVPSPDGLSVPADWYSAQLLPDWPDDWVVLERERFRLLALHALENLSDWYRRTTNYACAVDTALAAIRIDPLRESAHRALVSAHLAEGNVAEAIRHVENYRVSLRRELGIGPSARLLEMVGLQTRQVAAVD